MIRGSSVAGGRVERALPQQVAEFRRQPVFALGVVEAEDARAGGGQRQLQAARAVVCLVTRLRQIRDVLAEAVHLVAAGLQLAAGAVKHPQVAPAAVAGAVADQRLVGAFLAGQALADGGVDVAVVLVLDHLQHADGHRILIGAVAKGEFAGEVVDLGVGIVAPDADLGVVHQPAAGGVVGLHPLQHRALAGHVDQGGQDAFAQRLQVEAQPARSVGALEAEGLHAFAGGRLGGGGADTVAQRLAGQAGGRNLQQFGEGGVGLEDAQLGVEHGHGDRQGRETQAVRPPGRGVLGGVQRCHDRIIGRAG